jgi:hypothetical protein
MIVNNSYFVTQYNQDNLTQPVIPYQGKHAVKTADFFNIISANQSSSMPESWVYRPLKVEVEITNGCNISCPNCGMSAKSVTNCDILPDKILKKIIMELSDFGIPGVSITGGEPFTAFSNLLAFINECRGAVDVVKLTTNAFWAKTYHSAKEYLQQLKGGGFTETKFFRPVLLLSIGEQSIPLFNVVNALIAARELFNEKELALCISSLSERFEDDKLAKLEACYTQITGNAFPWPQIFLTSRNYIAAGNALNTYNFPQRKIPIQKMVKAWGCFSQTIGSFVVPTPLIKANGDVFSCSVFGMPEKLKLGNIFKNSFFELLESANNNPYIRVIAKGDLPLLQSYIEQIKLHDISVDNFHEACWKLINIVDVEKIK